MFLSAYNISKKISDVMPKRYINLRFTRTMSKRVGISDGHKLFILSLTLTKFPTKK